MKPGLTPAHQYWDPHLSFEYELVIPYIPSDAKFNMSNENVFGGDYEEAISRQYGASTSGAGLMRIFSTAIATPEKTIDEVLVNLAGGHELVFAGLQKTAHDVAVTLKERRDLSMWNSINRWSEYCRAHQTQHGHYKKDYSVTARLFVFDQISKEVARFVLYGFWPNNVPSIAYDASASNAIEHSITFKCDFFENEMTEETTDWANSIWGPHQNRPF